MKKIVCLPVMFLFAFSAFAQSKVENIIMITIYGCRRQEVFGGADSVILFNDKFRKSDASRSLFPRIGNGITI